MNRIWATISTLLALSMFSAAVSVADTAFVTDIADRCQVSENPEYITRFKAAYNELTSGNEFGNQPIYVLDCEYLLIIETPLPPLGFGSDVAYIIWKDGFKIILARFLN